MIGAALIIYSEQQKDKSASESIAQSASAPQAPP
jgi:hypothetical protein